MFKNFLLLLLLISVPVFGQTKKDNRNKPTRHFLAQRTIPLKKKVSTNTFSIVSYSSLSKTNVNFSSGIVPNYYIQNNSFGNLSSATFSARVDANIVKYKAQLVLMPNATYINYINPKLSYTFYIHPKYNVTTHQSLVKYGVYQNYALSKSILVGVSFGYKLIEDGTTKSFGYIKFIYLIPTH